MNATADTIKQLPVMGFIWAQEFKFAFDNQDSVVQIHTETWEYKLCDGKHTLTRFTNYYGMGTDVQTLILTEL
jgi:hypothetical protein